ncbi:hypothetical protein KR044_006484 [Drosophila immigrans]|nr:hypothetical protein KR044_006484 [Drosophila immigrans]
MTGLLRRGRTSRAQGPTATAHNVVGQSCWKHSNRIESSCVAFLPPPNGRQVLRCCRQTLRRVGHEVQVLRSRTCHTHALCGSNSSGSSGRGSSDSSPLRWKVEAKEKKTAACFQAATRGKRCVENALRAENFPFALNPPRFQNQVDVVFRCCDDATTLL